MRRDPTADGDALQPGGIRLILLAAAAAFLDGVDVQSMGLALPSLIAGGGISPGQAGMLGSASLLGLMIGAFVGGRTLDRYGPRAVMLVSLVILGLFSLLTVIPVEFATLLALRCLAGLGMGGVLPVILAMTRDAARPRFRATALGIVYGAGPVGSMAAAAVAWLMADWRWVFYLGGFGPLVLIPALFLLLPKDWGRGHSTRAAARPAQAGGHVRHSLFGEGRAPVTVALWCAGALTVLVTYLNLNWLPAILMGRGFSLAGAQAAMILFNAGCMVGDVAAGRLIDAGRRDTAMRFGYLATIAAVVVLALAPTVSMTLAAVFAVGVTAVGCQLLLLATGNDHYPDALRGTGIGTLIAVNRLGSLTGPLAAGALLSIGLSVSQVLLATTPGLLIAGAAALFIVRRTSPPRPAAT